MEDLKNSDLQVSAPEAEGGNPNPNNTETSQNLLQKELERVSKKTSGKTKREKLLFTKNRLEKQLQELDEEEGIEPSVVEDDENAPVTVGMLKRLEAERAAKTAVQLAEDIEDESEKELVKYHLQNTIKSTGNPKEDLRNARALANSARNAQIAEEASRKTSGSAPRTGGAPALRQTAEPELTLDEQAFMKPPFNLSKEEILKRRPKFSK